MRHPLSTPNPAFGISENRNIAINCHRRWVRVTRAGAPARALSRKLSRLTPPQSAKKRAGTLNFINFTPRAPAQAGALQGKGPNRMAPGNFRQLRRPALPRPRSRLSAELGAKMELPTAQNAQKIAAGLARRPRMGRKPSPQRETPHSPPLQLAEAKRDPGATKRTCLPLRLWHATGVAGRSP